VPDIFLFHSPADRDVAAAIAERLERGAEAQVRLEVCGPDTGETVADVWEQGLASAAILLLLSPSSVPARLRREDWEALLEHTQGGGSPPVGVILAGQCPYPKLLERKHFFRWPDDAQCVLRDLTHWILNLGGRREPSFAPARLTWFQGRQRELDQMWETLVDESGAMVLANASPGSGKTALAQEFVHLAGSHFRDIHWVECGTRPEISIAGELAAQLGVSLGNSGEDALARTGALIQERRVLLVFDDLPAGLPIATTCGGRASVLVTTRFEDPELLPGAHLMQLERVEPATPEREALTPAARQLWDAALVCRPQGFPLELAARIARLDEVEAQAACQDLVRQRWLDPIDAAASRFRPGAGACAARESRGGALNRWHAEALVEIFSKWRIHPILCKGLLAETDSAFEWALDSNWRLATALAHRAFAFLKSEGRLAEAIDLYKRVINAAVDRNDRQEVEDCTWELSWIHDEGAGLRRTTENAEQIAFNFAEEPQSLNDTI
jgi:hypothetical protein